MISFLFGCELSHSFFVGVEEVSLKILPGLVCGGFVPPIFETLGEDSSVWKTNRQWLHCACGVR